MDRVRPPFGRYKVKATVDGELAADAVLKFMVPGAKAASAAAPAE